jgi:putative ABC transport system ATP-binding protein
MSGGQQQRVAIARALVTKPAVVFADEPTGNLDSRSGALVLDLLRRCVREFGRAVVMVTHDPVAASYADRVIFLADGALTGSVGQPTPQAVIDAMKLLSAGDLA